MKMRSNGADISGVFLLERKVVLQPVLRILYEGRKK